MEDAEPPPAQAPRDRQPGLRIAGRDDHDQRPRPDHPGEPAEEVLERRRRVRADPGQEVAGTASLVLARARREERDPIGGPGERGDGEATGRALGLERPGQRGGHDAQRLREVVVVAAGPAGSLVWMSRATTTSRSRDGSNRLTTGTPSRAVVRQWTWRTGSPGAYGRTPANRAGSSTRPRRARSGPDRSRAASNRRTGTVRGPDDQRRREMAILLRDRLAEQIAGRQPDRSEPVDPAALRPEVDPPDGTLVGPERPAVDQGPAADRPEPRPDVAVDRLELDRQRLLGTQPGQRQELPVPGRQDEMGLVAAHHPVGLEAALEAEPAEGPPRPDRAQPGDDEDDDPEHHEDGDPEHPADEDEHPAEQRAEVDLAGGDRRGQTRVVVRLRGLFDGVGPVARPATGRSGSSSGPLVRGRRPGPGRRPRCRPGSARRSRRGASCRGRPAAGGRARPGRSPGCRRAGRSRGRRGTPRPGRPGTARRSRAGSPRARCPARSRVAATIATR